MKQVGIVTSTLTSGHSVRGIGFYTRGLLSGITQMAQGYDIQISEIANPSSPGFDLIHIPFFDLFTHSLPLIKHTATVVTVHDVIPLDFPRHYPPGIRGRFNFLLQKRALANVSAVITDSYASIRQIKTHLSVPDSKLQLVYLAPAPNIHKTSHTSILKKFHLPEKFILCVNDVNYNKNLVNLIKAVQSVHIPLVLVGKQAAQLQDMDLHHPELSHLQEIIPYLDSPLLIRPGFVTDDELSALYSQASLYCHTSFAEGFGIGVANALVCGCPVVCSNTSCLPEIAGDAAIYIDPESIDSISSGIKIMLNDSGLRTKMVKLGFTQIKKFTWEQTARQTLQVYRRILSS